ncbi:MAG: hypothetical protein HY551_02715 [Elusimicrobia bacterium]|nr:hypothetical protein [Elusimicrobiota bacterium]
MKKIILLAALLTAGWYFRQWLRKAGSPENIKQSAPVRYVDTLQRDVEKAKAAGEAANAHIQKAVGEVKQAVQEIQEP